MISQKIYGDLYCIDEKIIPPTILQYKLWLQLQGLGEIFYPWQQKFSAIHSIIISAIHRQDAYCLNGWEQDTHTHIVECFS